MFSRRAWSRSFALALPILISCSVVAQHGEMSAEEQEMMKKWEAAGTPGAEHQKLAKRAGDWKLDIKHWMDPAAPPMTSKGTARYEVAMGGRYVIEHVTGEGMHGETFKGMGVEGYDNVRKKYISTWIDNMSTGIMTMEGTCDGTGKCNFEGEAPDPMSGGTKKVNAVIKNMSDDKFMFEMYEPGPDGKLLKTMEILYTR